MRPAAVVCADIEEARVALSAGTNVVVVVAPAALVDLEGLRAAGPGRLAVLVGDADEPADRQAAAEMAAEVFGRSDATETRED